MGSGSGSGSSCMASSSVSSEKQMNIYLKVMKTVALNVKRSDRISDLKALFCEKEGVSEHFQELYYSGERLNDEHKLIDCGIQDNSTLNLYVQTSGLVKLLVTIVSKQKTVEIEAKSKETIENIKTKVCSKEGINLSNQFSLFYAGTLLENYKTLSSLGIEGNSTLLLVLNPRDVLSVSVELPNSKMVKMEIKLLYTVADFKAFVGTMAGFPAGDHCLFYQGEEMEDSKTLACYDLKEDSMLKIGPYKIQIFVKVWSGKTITLYIRQKETVGDVKKEVYRKLCLAPNEYHVLVYRSEVLEDGRDLGSYGIEKQSTLCMDFKPRTFVQPVKVCSIRDFEKAKLRTTTIGELTKLIETKYERTVKKILFNGRVLEAQHSLRNYAINKDSMLDVQFQKSVELVSNSEEQT